MKKIKMPSTKDINKAVSGATKTVEKTVDKAADTVVNETTKAADKVADTVVDTTKAVVNDVTKAATDGWNYAVALANDTAAVMTSVGNTVAKNTEEAAKQGFDVASTEWKQGSEIAQNLYREGAEAIVKAAEDAYAWADANACRIGLTYALTLGVVSFFTPKPAPADPGTVNSTAASMTWVAWFASQGGKAATMAQTMTISCSIAYIVSEGLFMIPGVKGQVSKNLVFNVLSNCINTTITNAYLWGTPAGVGIAVGSAISPVVSTLICEGVVPRGMSKGPDAKAAEDGIKMAKDALKSLGIS
jgi:hypothetical protein